METLLSAGPLRDTLIYYGTVTASCELARHVCDRFLDKKSTLFLFAIEFLGTLQVTTTIFENGVVDIYFGRQMFALTLFTMGLVFAFCTRGAFCSPLAPFEQYVFGKMKLKEFIRTIIAQLFAGYCSYRFARTIWTQTYVPSEAHTRMASLVDQCQFNHQYQLYVHLAFELIGTFIVRHVLVRATSEERDSRIRTIFPAFFMAMVFTGTVTYVGDQALDPLVATTLFYGCRGIDVQQYILIYWLAPVVGWLASAYVDNSKSKKLKNKVEKEEKKKLKNQKKNN
ncbi:unnamed protein product [Caenorhabditis bovis]|uniref:Aquaporin n=1 Tax=Caenorhabditis bovis TaxID=2654633 RepID=A0A8S1ERV9_9PELO|nr:unnamed protein product [Caenorhabditis bovis]